MRIRIEINDRLLAEAMESGGHKTKKAAIEEGLRLLVNTRSQERVRKLRGKLRWDGSLDEMRRD
ncbi:MAG: type II toxin-antitoxin system VapB family antitoxin [Gammaproteobacteria bacterium]|nr:type II toxin-antitoxin system VapB family antitoxin [Gammaproteobacteria bacterium]